MAEGLWYTEAVRWAASEGIVNGVSDTSYAPDNAITREQMAAILYRYAQYKGYDTSVGGMSLAEYTDADQISSYATTAIAVGERERPDHRPHGYHARTAGHRDPCRGCYRF